MARLIFHIYVNSACLSWEATRRVNLGEEDIRLIPSAIGGDRDKRTGVILAKSIPAKNTASKPVNRWPWHFGNAQIYSWQDLTSAVARNPQRPSWISAGNTRLWSRNTPLMSASWTCQVPIRSIRIQLQLLTPSRTKSGTLSILP